MSELIISVLTYEIYLALLIGLFGGLMHGFTGWGGAMVMMPLMSLLFGPIQALAIILVGSMLVCSQLFFKASKKANWREMAPLLVSVTLFIPIGNVVLFHLDPSVVIRVIGILIIGAGLLQLSGWSYKGPRGILPSATAGMACGIINGFAGVGGPPLVLYVLSKPDPADLQRANIVISVTIISFVIFISLVIGGGVDKVTVTQGIVIAPAQMVGAFLGAKLFQILPSEIFKKFSLIMLVILGALIILL